MTVRQALVLVGGRGTRMWPLTAEVPKPLIPLAGLPFLELQLRQIAAAGVEEAVLAVGEDDLAAFEDFAARRTDAPDIRFVVERERLDTAGPVVAGLDVLDERFLVLNGDVIVETDLSGYLRVDYTYTSVVELGMYRLTARIVEELREGGVDPLSPDGRERLEAALEEERSKAYVQSRLRPRQPEDMPYVCFYPMDKRRAPGQNWYTLPLEERNELMIEHGEIGRLYAGRISQIISGSIGFDDWEWGVTLFAGEPLDFKRLVSEMRFDEASALYAEFGPFYVGRRMGSGGWTGLVEGA